jgi:hypothetical protein
MNAPIQPSDVIWCVYAHTGRKIDRTEADDEVIGLWRELKGRADSNGVAWTVLQTLLLLLDFRVIHGPAWESAVNMGALVYPGCGLLIKYAVFPFWDK